MANLLSWWLPVLVHARTNHTHFLCSSSSSSNTCLSPLHPHHFLGVWILSDSPGWSRPLIGSPMGISDFYLSEIDWTSVGLNHWGLDHWMITVVMFCFRLWFQRWRLKILPWYPCSNWMLHSGRCCLYGFLWDFSTWRESHGDLPVKCYRK